MMATAFFFVMRRTASVVSRRRAHTSLFSGGTTCVSRSPPEHRCTLNTVSGFCFRRSVLNTRQSRPALAISCKMPDIYELNAAILGRVGIGRLEELLLTHTDRFQARRTDAEGIHQSRPHRVRALLAE